MTGGRNREGDTIANGDVRRKRRWVGEEIISGSKTMWEVAPESMTQPPLLEELTAVLFRAAMSAVQSHARVPYPGALGAGG
jgi:hypothetical protein